MDLSDYKTKMQAAVERLEEELKKVRTGRAHPSIIENVMVEAYGTPMPLKTVANITTPEPQLLQVTPFDPSNLAAISAAIRNDQNLGLNPSDDGRVLRVPMPPLTEERRSQIVKSLSDTIEEAKISLRNIRHDALKEAKAKKDAKEMGEDEMARTEKEATELINQFQSQIDELHKAKEQEIMTL